MNIISNRDKMNIVKRFLENNILLTPEVYKKIKNLEENKIDELTQNKKLFLEKNDIKKKSEDKESKTLRILNETKEKKNKFKIPDLVDHYNKRFNILKEILKKRIKDKNLISINKLSSYGLEGTLIGMIREIRDNSVFIEDNTSSIEVITDEKLVEDEVIGVKGKMKKEKFLAEEIYYPGLSFKRNINKLDREIEAFFISNLNFKNKKIKAIRDVIENRKIKYIFGFTKEITKGFEKFENFLKRKNLQGIIIPKKKEKSSSSSNHILFSSDPTWSEISDKITILQHYGNGLEKYKDKLKIDSMKELSLSLLKKRHFDPSNRKNLNNGLLLRKIPDIVHFGYFNKFFAYNYKGTTVINTSSEKAGIVNLKTREIKDIKLN